MGESGEDFKKSEGSQLVISNGSRKYEFKDPITGELRHQARWHFYPPDSFMKAAVIHYGEEARHTNFRLFLEGNIDLDERFGDRVLRLRYDADGNYRGLVYEIWTNMSEDRPFTDNANFDGENNALFGSIDPNEFTFQTGEKPNTTFLKRIVDGKVVDEIVIPKKVDIEDLKFKFAPDPLLRNPHTEEGTYDTYWRDLDPVYEAGIRWDALGNDQYDSLGSTPQDIKW